MAQHMSITTIQSQAEGTGNQSQAQGTGNQSQAQGTGKQSQAQGTGSQWEAQGTGNQSQAQGSILGSIHGRGRRMREEERGLPCLIWYLLETRYDRSLQDALRMFTSIFFR